LRAWPLARAPIRQRLWSEIFTMHAYSSSATLAAGLSLILSAAAAANSSSKEEVVVTAAPLDDLLQPSEVLGGDQLLLRSAPTIGETLSSELGVSSTYFGPASSRPVIRGLSGSRVKMLTDSVSTLDVSDVSPDHAVAVEPLLAEQIEIIRGPTTLLYGSAAAGGVVNVSDNRIPEVPADKPIGGGIELRGDTAAGERALIGRLDGSVDGLSYHVDGYTRETDNIDIAGFATADPAERPADEVEGTLANSYSESDGFAAGASWAGARGYLGASVSRLKQTYGLPGPEVEEEGGDGEPELFAGPFLDMDQTRVDVRGEYRPEAGAWEAVKLAFGVNEYEHNEVEPTGEVATEFNNDAWQLRAEAVHAPLGGWRGALGLQVDDRDFSAIGEEAFVSPTLTEAWGLFIVEERDFGRSRLQLGARVEDLEHRNSVFSDYSETALSLGAGVGVDVAAASEVILNLSYSQRNPSAEELYSNGAHIATRQFEIGLLAVPGGAATLEKSTNVDLAWRREQGAVRWDAAVFYYDIGDYVFQDPQGDVEDGLPVVRYAQQDAEFFGVEAAITVPFLKPGRFENGLRLFADYVEAELADGRKLPRIPPWRFGANLELGDEAWLATADLVYHAKQDEISSFNTAAYTMLDLSFLYRLEAGPFNWELFARGTNLLDENARKSTSFLAAFAPLPGRSLHAGIRARF